jgi:hypothetical protein
MITLIENSECGSTLSTGDAEFVANYRQLICDRMLDGFARLRIAEMLNNKM